MIRNRFPSSYGSTFAVLERCVLDYDVIVVNDGSTDESGAVLEHLPEEYSPFLQVLPHNWNHGCGGALRTGSASAIKEWVFYTGGDGQYDPAELEYFLEHAESDVAVNGYKVARRDPWHRVGSGWLYNHFALGITLRDIDCDFRFIRRSLLSDLNLRSTTGNICIALVRGLEPSGMEIREIPVRDCPRLHGRSQFFRTKSLLLTFFQLCRLFCLFLSDGAALDAHGLKRQSQHGRALIQQITTCSDHNEKERKQ